MNVVAGTNTVVSVIFWREESHQCLDRGLRRGGRNWIERLPSSATYSSTGEPRNPRARGYSEIAAPHCCDYGDHVNRVTGTFRNGKVALDQPVDWPEGTQVVCEYGAQPEGLDVCSDGSPWEDTPEAIQRWVQWFDSLGPVLTGQELER